MWLIGKLLKYYYLFCIVFGLCENAKLSKSDNKESFNAKVNFYSDSEDSKIWKIGDVRSDTVIKTNSTKEKYYEIDDMILTAKQMEALYSKDPSKRLGLTNALQHWSKGIVPFKIDKILRKQEAKIKKAIRYIHNVSCVRFVDKSASDKHWVKFVNDKQCASLVGMDNSSPQPIFLNPSLCSVGNIVHEILHALGFLHMHKAPDRDQYITVNWKNIKEKVKKNFELPTAPISMFGTKYDYNSIMHYSTKAFAKIPGMKTLVPLNPAPNMGQRGGMSKGDIIRLNKMYKCPEEYITNLKSEIIKIQN